MYVSMFCNYLYFCIEMCMLSNRIEEYYFISQGKTRIPGVNDGDEFEVTDVSIAAIFNS